MQAKNKRQTSIEFEHIDKKHKVPQEKKSVKVEDFIVAAFSQVKNSNATVSTSSTQLKVQVKKEFNPEKSLSTPQIPPFVLQVVTKISRDAAHNDVHAAEQSTHNEH